MDHVGLAGQSWRPDRPFWAGALEKRERTQLLKSGGLILVPAAGEEPSGDAQGHEPAAGSRGPTGQQQQRLLQQALPPRKRGMEGPSLTRPVTCNEHCQLASSKLSPLAVVAVGTHGRRDSWPVIDAEKRNIRDKRRGR